MIKSLFFLLIITISGIEIIKCQSQLNFTECSKDDLRYNQCRNKGKCVKNTQTNEFSCLCDSKRYTGELCEKPKCLDYCYNNGKCLIDQNGIDLKCECDADGRYSGTRCQFDNCISQLENCPRNCVLNSKCECLCNEKCDKYYCNNQNGTCYEDSNGKLACKCRVGYSNPACQINDCRGYCFNGGTCNYNAISIYCECPSGYEGKRCSKLTVQVPAKYKTFKIALYSITLAFLISVILIAVYYSLKRGYFRDIISIRFSYKPTAATTSASSYLNSLDSHDATSTRTNIHFNKLDEENDVIA